MVSLILRVGPSNLWAMCLLLARSAFLASMYTNAPSLGQASTHFGSPLQRSHFFIFPSMQEMAPYGHMITQSLQPIHPSSLISIAPVRGFLAMTPGNGHIF